MVLRGNDVAEPFFGGSFFVTFLVTILCHFWGSFFVTFARKRRGGAVFGGCRKARALFCTIFGGVLGGFCEETTWRGGVFGGGISRHHFLSFWGVKKCHFSDAVRNDLGQKVYDPKRAIVYKGQALFLSGTQMRKVQLYRTNIYRGS